MLYQNDKDMKTFEFNFNGYTFTVERNKRKDCFLGIITNTNNNDYIEKIIPSRRLFLTLKGAKEHALELISKN